MIPSRYSLRILIRKSRKEHNKQHGSDNNESSSEDDGAANIPIAQLMNLKKGRGCINGPIQHSTSSQGTTQTSNDHDHLKFVLPTPPPSSVYSSSSSEEDDGWHPLLPARKKKTTAATSTTTAGASNPLLHIHERRQPHLLLLLPQRRLRCDLIPGVHKAISWSILKTNILKMDRMKNQFPHTGWKYFMSLLLSLNELNNNCLQHWILTHFVSDAWLLFSIDYYFRSIIIALILVLLFHLYNTKEISHTHIQLITVIW